MCCEFMSNKPHLKINHTAFVRTFWVTCTERQQFQVLPHSNQNFIIRSTKVDRGVFVCVFPEAYLAVRRSVNPVMVDSALVPQRNGPLAGAALALPDQEASVDARAEQVLRSVAWHGPMVPAVLLQAVDRGDVVWWHPTLAILGLCLAPLAVVVVTQHT